MSSPARRSRNWPRLSPPTRISGSPRARPATPSWTRSATRTWTSYCAQRLPSATGARRSRAAPIRNAARGGRGTAVPRQAAARGACRCIAVHAELCGALLPVADDVRVLATSREPIGVAREARYRLRPLAVPGPGGHVKTGDSSSAVALFADRARQADAHFTLIGKTGPAVAQIVARLDGMPLAIELAAARVEAL